MLAFDERHLGHPRLKSGAGAERIQGIRLKSASGGLVFYVEEASPPKAGFGRATITIFRLPQTSVWGGPRRDLTNAEQ